MKSTIHIHISCGLYEIIWRSNPTSELERNYILFFNILAVVLSEIQIVTTKQSHINYYSVTLFIFASHLLNCTLLLI
nr:unnamed protein product [Callosobruchus chinensis]